MKKYYRILSIAFFLVFLYGCGSSNIEKSENVNTSSLEIEEIDIRDYFPMIENTRCVYDGSGNEYASFQVYNDYTSENMVQQRIINSGTVMSKIIEVKEQSVTVILSRGEAYYRENLLSTTGEEGEVLLMAPIVKGTTWVLKDSRVRTITDTVAQVITPIGKYEAVEVTTEGENDKVTDYYAKGIGLIKTVFNSGEYQVTSSLSKIDKDTSLKQNISFFYPNAQDVKIYYKNKEVTFNTNDITKDVLEKTYKEIIEEVLGETFNTNTKINSLYLNKDGMVYLDLNAAFLTDIKLGSGYEEAILQCIANTFGKYYNAKKVVLTIDNRAYESGHILLKKGQYLEVNLEDASEAK